MMDPARPLAGTHALVTGGGRGIGAAVSRELARLGASVSLLGRTPGPLEALAAELSAAYTHGPLDAPPPPSREVAAQRPEGVEQGAEAGPDTPTRSAGAPSRGQERPTPVPTSHPQAFRAAPADVTEADALAEAVGQARDALGPITVLVNNAGAARSAPFHRLDEAHWQAMLDVNLTAAYRCTRLALGDMREAGWGRVVNVASTAGLTGYAYVAAYCAAKHGLVGLTRALAAELAQTGITVNAVCPGYVDTDLVARSVEAITETTGRSEDEVRAHLAGQNPTGRLVTPEEVASAVGWLCGPAQGQVTGVALPIAGGEVG